MSTERNISLCERIKAYCHQRNWYGPDMNMQGFIGAYYVHGTLQRREFTHDPRTGFEFPPATEEQLRLTEKAMGFPLPPLLRMLYLHVANGGFGPGSGITGAFGGFCYWVGRDVRYNSMQKDRFLEECGQDVYNECAEFFEEGSLDLEQYEQRHNDPKSILLGPHAWPTHFLYLCGWGCGMSSYLHGKSGRVYLAAAADGLTLDGEFDFTWLERQANSLEEWLEYWLEGKEELWNDELEDEIRKERQQYARYPEPEEEYFPPELDEAMVRWIHE